jgi:hypothetical protein
MPAHVSNMKAALAQRIFRIHFLLFLPSLSDRRCQGRNDRHGRLFHTARRSWHRDTSREAKAQRDGTSPPDLAVRSDVIL